MKLMVSVHRTNQRLLRPCCFPKTLFGGCTQSSTFPFSCIGSISFICNTHLAATTRRNRLTDNLPRQGRNLTLCRPNKHRTRSIMSLTQSTDPLVWIDCEMTGLDPEEDSILSISCYITDHKLEVSDSHGYHAIISTPASVLASMSEWCVTTHTATGLVDACQSASAISASQAAMQLLEYIKRHVPEPRVALLAGNSVHADKMFLMRQPWTPVLEWLHYRILDVSAIKEAVRRWGSQNVLDGVPKKKLTHTADEDIRESLDEARYYMQLIQRLGSP